MSYTTESVKVTAADTSRDATGTAYELYRAATDCYVDRVIFQPLGTNNATAARVFINEAAPTSLGENNFLVAEATCGGTTASETAALAAVELVIDRYLRAGQRLLVTVGTAPTAGFTASAIVGNRYQDFYV